MAEDFTPKVYVTKRSDRKNYYFVYENQKGVKVWKSSGTRVKRDANRLAIDYEKEIVKSFVDETVRWSCIVDRYIDEHLSKHSKHNKTQFMTASGRFVCVFGEPSVRKVGDEMIVKFTSAMIDDNCSPSSVNAYLRQIRAFLKWCKKKRIITSDELPVVEMLKIKPEDVSRGRALTSDGLKKVIDTIPLIVERYWESWRDFILGLWHSGFRVNELLKLSWDDPKFILVDGIDTSTPLFSIPSDGQKSGKREDCPIMPGCVELLRKTPKSDRVGFVFNPIGLKGTVTRSPKLCVRYISKFGKRSGVVVKIKHNGEKKYASAHDLKRSFATEHSNGMSIEQLMWATRNSTEAVLRKFYLRSDAQNRSLQIQKAMGIHIEKE